MQVGKGALQLVFAHEGDVEATDFRVGKQVVGEVGEPYRIGADDHGGYAADDSDTLGEALRTTLLPPLAHAFDTGQFGLFCCGIVVLLTLHGHTSCVGSFGLRLDSLV